MLVFFVVLRMGFYFVEWPCTFRFHDRSNTDALCIRRSCSDFSILGYKEISRLLSFSRSQFRNTLLRIALHIHLDKVDFNFEYSWITFSTYVSRDFYKLSRINTTNRKTHYFRIKEWSHRNRNKQTCCTFYAIH